MKVVLFCGGMGTRLRDYSEEIPKPLVPVGYRPIMWNLMRYYAHYGHREFVLCLGYKANKIKDYFVNYEEWVSNDFVLDGGGEMELLQRDTHDWRLTFVDTGIHANIGQRLWSVRDHVGDDEMFMANYSDGLSDLPLGSYVEDFKKSDKIACFVSVPVPHTFHVVETGEGNLVKSLAAVTESSIRINGGFFIFKKAIFEYMRPGEELVFEPFERLIKEDQLVAYPYDGFWRSMDTFKDQQKLAELDATGNAPWQVWKS